MVKIRALSEMPKRKNDAICEEYPPAGVQAGGRHVGRLRPMIPIPPLAQTTPKPHLIAVGNKLTNADLDDPVLDLAGEFRLPFAG
jgi:hypothetical protein